MMRARVTCPKTCRECCGDGFVRRDEERPVRWRWSEAEGYDPTNTETCPRCGGDGYEPEDSTEENDQ